MALLSRYKIGQLMGKRKVPSKYGPRVGLVHAKALIFKIKPEGQVFILDRKEAGRFLKLAL